MDGATKENLDKLVTIGERLLKNPVSRVNLDTGLTEPVKDGGTNQEAIKRYYYYFTKYIYVTNYRATCNSN